MKKLLFGVLTLIILVFAIILIAPNFIDWNKYKSQAEQELEKQTDLNLTINGNLKFSVLPSPRFIVEQVEIKAPEQKKYTNIVEFERLDVAVKLAPLIQGQVNISSVTIKRPTISIEKLKDGSINAQTEKMSQKSDGSETAEATSPSLDIALDNITIKDATLQYYDHATEAETRIQNINADLSAQSLLGPYKAQGSLFYGGSSVNFNVATDQLNTETLLITPNIKMSIEPTGVELSYNGVVSLDGEPSLQGQTEFSIPNLSSLSSTIKTGKSLSAKGLLTADANQASFKNLKVLLGDEEISGSFKAQLDPLQYDISLKSAQPLDLVDALGNAIPYKTADFDMSVKGSDKKADLSFPKLKLDNTNFKINGSVDGLNKDRPNASVNITVAKLNLDELTKSQPKSSGTDKTDPKEAVKSLVLPVDLDLNFQSESLIFDKKEIKGLNLSSSFKENSLEIKKLSIKDALGAQIEVKSNVKSLNANPQLDAYVTINAQNIRAVLSALGMDVQNLPEGVKTVSLKTKLDGSLDQLNMTANIGALGADIITKGRLSDPLSNLTLSNIELQVKHKNLAQAVEKLSGVPIKDANLTKPLDFYTKINQQGKTYNLSEIKGDLSGTSVNGELSINTGTKVPSIKGDLNFGKLTLTALAEKKQTSSKERWSKEPIDVSGLHAANVDITLKANTINYGGWPLQKPSLQIKLNDGNLDINNLNAQIFGGTINAQIKAQTSAEPRQPVYFESVSSFKNADIGKLAKSLIGTQLVKLSGNGNVDMQVKSSGPSVAALIYDLAGKGTIDAKSIVLEGIDVNRFVRALSEQSKPGDTLTGLWKGSTKGGSTSFETLTGGFTITEGVASLNEINLDGPQTKIETNGKIDLPRWTMETKHKMIVKGTEEQPSDVPPFEMTFKGSLDNPTQTFGKGLLEDYLNRKIQRKFNKLLSDKFGVPVPSNDNSKRNTQSEDQKQNKPKSIEDAAEDAIKGVLDGLLR